MIKRVIATAPNDLRESRGCPLPLWCRSIVAALPASGCYPPSHHYPAFLLPTFLFTGKKKSQPFHGWLGDPRGSYPPGWCDIGAPLPRFLWLLSFTGKESNKKNLVLCAKQYEVKKFPAPCYSPIVKFTVPSPLESLTNVFGKGTCVSTPP